MRAARASGATLVAALALALAAPARAQSGLGYDVSGRTEVRVRSLAAPGEGDVATAELELTPALRLALARGLLGFTAGYSPSIAFYEPYRLGPVRAYHRANAGLRLAWSRTSLSLSEDFGYGTAQVGVLTTPEGAPAGTTEAAAPVLVPMLRSSTQLAFTATLDRHLDLTASAGYLVSGGLGSELLPLQRGPAGQLSLRGRLSRLDTLDVALLGSQADFSNGAAVTLLEATETWQRRLGHVTNFSLTAGLGVIRQRVVLLPGAAPTGPFTDPLPAGFAAVSHRLHVTGTVLELRFRAGAGPFVDRVAGASYERLEATAAAAWALRREWLVNSEAGATYALPSATSPRSGDRMVWAGGSVEWAPYLYLQARAELRLAWLEQPSLGLPGRVYWLTGVSVTFSYKDAL